MARLRLHPPGDPAAFPVVPRERARSQNAPRVRARTRPRPRAAAGKFQTRPNKKAAVRPRQVFKPQKPGGGFLPPSLLRQLCARTTRGGRHFPLGLGKARENEPRRGRAAFPLGAGGLRREGLRSCQNTDLGSDQRSLHSRDHRGAPRIPGRRLSLGQTTSRWHT